jgi:hypothetical protein
MKKSCVKDGCDSPAYSKYYCSKHYWAIENKLKSCKIEGCQFKHYINGYCKTHYNQLRHYGKIVEFDYTKNLILLNLQYGQIIFHDKNSKEICRSNFDLDDLHLVNLKKCKINSEGYIQVGSFRLHQLIMNHDTGLFIDHIDKNPINNLKSNLRLCTPQENSCNAKKYMTNSSGVTGVSFINNTKKWRALICVNWKTIYLGEYENFYDAVQARKAAEVKYFNANPEYIYETENTAISN